MIILSLIPSPALMLAGFDNSDKLYHAFAYASLMWWFAVGYRRHQWLTIAIGFAVLGLVIEGLQSLTPDRTASLADELADVCGILLGIFAATKTPTGFPPFRHAEYRPY
ncbi:MAG: VanZ family protein [Gammaproteobacteria bacterium]|nr:VanZ family protein [Gammaproteobacteria bacterium]